MPSGTDDSTADNDYAADYDTDYEKPIKRRCFDRKSPKIAYLTRLFSQISITTDTSNNRPDNEYYRCICTALREHTKVFNTSSAIIHTSFVTSRFYWQQLLPYTGSLSLVLFIYLLRLTIFFSFLRLLLHLFPSVFSLTSSFSSYFSRSSYFFFTHQFLLFRSFHSIVSLLLLLITDICSFFYLLYPLASTSYFFFLLFCFNIFPNILFSSFSSICSSPSSCFSCC